MEIKGNAIFIDKDDIDTDMIIPAKYLNTDDPAELGKHAMEFLDTDFSTKVKENNYEILVAGENFGCGSSREHAVWCLTALGIKVVIAKSFARIFFRNSINAGLLPIKSEDFDIDTGDEIIVTEKSIFNKTKNKEFGYYKFPEFMKEIVDSGGLINHIKKRIETKNPGSEMPLNKKLGEEE